RGIHNHLGSRRNRASPRPDRKFATYVAPTVEWRPAVGALADRGTPTKTGRHWRPVGTHLVAASDPAGDRLREAHGVALTAQVGGQVVLGLQRGDDRIAQAGRL